MSLVGKVGRTRPRARLAMAVVYGLLILGAVTTLYPFLLMVSTALKGPTDQNDNRLIPAYLNNDAELLAKYRDDKYAGDLSQMASADIGADAAPEVVKAYEKFLEALPTDRWVAGFRTAPNQVTGRLQARYQAWLRNRYGNDIRRLNDAYLDENVGFQTAVPPAELRERVAWKAPDTRKFREYLEFKQTLPAEFRLPVRQQRLWQEWLRAQTQNQLGQVASEDRQGAESFEEIPPPGNTDAARRFREFGVPAAQRLPVEDLWQRRLDDQGLPPQPMPIAALERESVEARPNEVRREMAGRNFGYVLDYVLLNGRVVANTALFCLLAIATQLIVNPLAAYALSRYPVKQSGAILIFLLATMAFPAEVAMIPSFLLLRDAGLLNTFWALVLPTAASGYMIFLLKGFFDSLPQELFEAGQIDGARETTMMWKIALPLSRPVLGYLALLAFMGAYGAFLFAFLICQDQSMWTLMVWIYQLQSVAPKAVMMAALTLAALPTLIVFLLTQQVIMRGIVLPGER
jgi:multiple sugar transport system permease protein